MFSLVDAGKRKGSDSDSYDDDENVEGSFQIASEQDDTMEKDLIAASKLSTPVSLIGCRLFVLIVW